MNEQLVLTLVASAIGVLSAVFFCIGNAFNSTEKIVSQSGTWYDFNEPLARALAAQRAQYVTGGLLLFIAFGFQVWAALAPPIALANLPRWLGTWYCLILAVLILCGCFSWLGCRAIERSTIDKVMRRHRQNLSTEK